MVCPFLEELVDIEAQALCRNLHRERVIRPYLDVLSFPDDYLFECFCTIDQSSEQYSQPSCKKFHIIAGFPGMIGCIDSAHIPITAPSVNEGDYVNRKSFHSINVQIICDAAHIISIVEAKWPRSVHDSQIVHECTRREFNGYLLGDRGYTCQPYLLSPYPDPEHGPQQRYNLAHCKTRARIDMTIGMLKARFQCLRRLRKGHVTLCVILHNITTIRGEQCPTQPVNDPDNDPGHPADTRETVRDTICYHHF
ncbi:unnamed protein product [Oncorhynchus mykiss]|uniref:DDE Tnp4 domain-containing protein n=1 Tax=Oncorhynchus mykiss TaxID=8022 RepID=A0A060XYW2_ONCMY|nr:unnamed protein product [Oncorhynchus mykiss]